LGCLAAFDFIVTADAMLMAAFIEHDRSRWCWYQRINRVDIFLFVLILVLILILEWSASLSIP